MIRVGILGATGYTARELIRLLLQHPEVEITTLTSRQEGSPHISEVHPQFVQQLDLTLENLGPKQVAEKTDCIFSCLPHAASASVILELADAAVKVVDFSADYRLNDSASYQEWYDQEHPDATRLGKVVYGLPELFRTSIANADLVANPGCYPTAAILALAPFIKAKTIDPTTIIVDAKSGLSGAGRSPKLTTHFAEANESVSAYSLGQHRHMPEMEQVLGRISDADPSILFAPHLIPMNQGILATVYANPTLDQAEEQWLELLADFYAQEPFVRVVRRLPATKDTLQTNYCDITVRKVRGRVVILSAIDNLGKGASGAAVQNMNIMFAFPETMAL